MELKHITSQIKETGLEVLLIVPCGIETMKWQNELKLRAKLLIVPCGIETNV